jgi:tRNA dimethylallyltransferase
MRKRVSRLLFRWIVHRPWHAVVRQRPDEGGARDVNRNLRLRSAPPHLPFMNLFFIVGPTATGKSEIAADVASALDAEIVSADAFQIYRGLDLLTAKPDAETLAKVPHHLIGAVSLLEEMNAEKFRRLACRAIDEIHSRGKFAIVVGGSGLYIKALTHGLTDLASGDPKLRARLNELSLEQLREKIVQLDPETADKIDIKNRRRLIRAIEICLLTRRPMSAQRMQAVGARVLPRVKGDLRLRTPKVFASRQVTSMEEPRGVFLFRDRDELYERINSRVETMFKKGVIEEVRAIGAVSETASQMIGLRAIRELQMSPASLQATGSLLCIAQIQQATRRYAKRQLTWFRHQTNFRLLNLSLLTHNEAVKSISQLAKAFGVGQGND